MNLLFQRNIIYDAAHAGSCRIDLVMSANVKAAPLLIWFHGGGLESGIHTPSAEIVDFAQTYGIAVASCGYRMYPEAKYPDFVDDAARAVAHLLKDARADLAFSSVWVGGSSAGAYLAMMLCFDKNRLASLGVDNSRISGWIFDAAQPTTHYNILRERGEDTGRVVIDEAAPLYYVHGELSEAARRPMLFIGAENDIPGRNEQNALLRATLLAHGYPEANMESVIMPGYGHTEYDAARDESGFVLTRLCAEFMRRHSRI